MKIPIKIAILDLYNEEPNQGMRCIKNITEGFKDQAETAIFDVRAKEEIAGTDHDIYIFTGGPGNPLEGEENWEEPFYKLIHDLWNWNMSGRLPKKYAFFICHSFQMACHLFGVGEITKRKSKAFGVFPVHKTPAGQLEPLFSNLPNPFYGADFRDYQVISPMTERLEDLESSILALEKIRPHVDLERAIMAIRFSEEFFGVQFHPEADAEGMLQHFSLEVQKSSIIENHGEEKYRQIIQDLENPERIALTHKTLLPEFIKKAIKELQKASVLIPEAPIDHERADSQAVNS